MVGSGRSNASPRDPRAPRPGRLLRRRRGARGPDRFARSRSSSAAIRTGEGWSRRRTTSRQTVRDPLGDELRRGAPPLPAGRLRAAAQERLLDLLEGGLGHSTPGRPDRRANRPRRGLSRPRRGRGRVRSGATGGRSGPDRGPRGNQSDVLAGRLDLQGRRQDCERPAQAGRLRRRPAGREAEFLAPFDVRRLPGVGPRSEARLRAAGIETIGSLAALSDERMRDPCCRARSAGSSAIAPAASTRVGSRRRRNASRSARRRRSHATSPTSSSFAPSCARWPTLSPSISQRRRDGAHGDDEGPLPGLRDQEPIDDAARRHRRRRPDLGARVHAARPGSRRPAWSPPARRRRALGLEPYRQLHSSSRFRPMAAEPTTQPAAGAGTVTIGDLTVNRLALGAMRLTGPGVIGEPADSETSLAVLRRAVELGVNFIDTADSYGPEVNERQIAEALHPYPEGLVIGTKGGLLHERRGEWRRDGRPDSLRAACEASLERLRRERIDLYQLHSVDPTSRSRSRSAPWPSSSRKGRSGTSGSRTSIRGSWRSRVRSRRSSRCRTATTSSTGYSEGVLDACERDGIAFLPWFPLGFGELARARGRLAEVASAQGRPGADRDRLAPPAVARDGPDPGDVLCSSTWRRTSQPRRSSSRTPSSTSSAAPPVPPSRSPAALRPSRA